MVTAPAPLVEPGQPGGHGGPADLGPFASRKLPPVGSLAMAVMAFVLAGGIYIAAYLPRHVALGVPGGLLGVAFLVLITNIALLARVRDFAWPRFFQVSGWALLAYVFIAGMIEYVFVYDGTRGTTLFVMTAMLVVFAVDVPMLLGFSVARYQEP
ncbi:MAG: hypothetical protein ACYCSF_12020 [Acidimicrobiales bacterium]